MMSKITYEQFSKGFGILNEIVDTIDSWWDYEDMDDKNHLWMKILPSSVKGDGLVDDRKRLIELNEKWIELYDEMFSPPNYYDYLYRDLFVNNQLTTNGSDSSNPYGDEVGFTLKGTMRWLELKNLGERY